MKQDNEYLETSLWFKEEIVDPYQTLAEFFMANDIADYRKVNKSMLLAASSNKIYRRTSPGDLLLHFELLESAINAAFVINQERKKSPIIIQPSDIFNKNLYCGWYSYLTEWDYFPRTLSLKEYINPYLVFKSFFKYQTLSEWKDDLRNILEYALAKDSMYEGSIKMDVLSAYFQLTKLMEAAHLIDVRETTHIGGIIKNREKLALNKTQNQWKSC